MDPAGAGTRSQAQSGDPVRDPHFSLWRLVQRSFDGDSDADNTPDGSPSTRTSCVNGLTTETTSKENLGQHAVHVGLRLSPRKPLKGQEAPPPIGAEGSPGRGARGGERGERSPGAPVCGDTAHGAHLGADEPHFRERPRQVGGRPLQRGLRPALAVLRRAVPGPPLPFWGNSSASDAAPEGGQCRGAVPPPHRWNPVPAPGSGASEGEERPTRARLRPLLAFREAFLLSLVEFCPPSLTHLRPCVLAVRRAGARQGPAPWTRPRTQC